MLQRNQATELMKNVIRSSNLQNLLFPFAKLFLLSKLLDGEGNVGDALFESVIGLLLKFRSRLLRLIDYTRRLADNSVCELLLIARYTRL